MKNKKKTAEDLALCDTVYPEDASLTQVYTAVSLTLKERRTTGKYFQSVARMMQPDPHCQNRTLQAMLWEQSERVLEAYPER